MSISFVVNNVLNHVKLSALGIALGGKKECAGLVIDDETTSATVEDEITKLLGLTHEPLDYVNLDGEFSLPCFKPSPLYFLYTHGHLSRYPPLFQNVVLFVLHDVMYKNIRLHCTQSSMHLHPWPSLGGILGSE